VVPEHAGVAKIELVRSEAQRVGKERVMKQQPAILIDHQQRRRAELQYLAELAFVLGELPFTLRERSNIVDPQQALAAHEADMPAAVRDLNVGQQEMDQSTVPGPPCHLLVENLAALLSQLLDDPRALIEVVPEHAGVAEIELV